MNNKTLVVYAHPSKSGHNGLVLKTVEKALKEMNVSFEVLDLCKMRFDPVMKAEEHFLANNRITPNDIKEIQQKVKTSGKLILIYPIWWNSAPAIMKGFFDRVLSAGFAYKYVPFIAKLGRPIGLLKTKQAVIFNTTGAPRILYWIIEGARGFVIASRDTLKFCGIRNKVFHYDFATKLDERAKRKIPLIVEKGLSWLFN